MTARPPAGQTHLAPKGRGRRLLYLGAVVVLLLLAIVVFSRSTQAGLWNRVVGFVTGRPLRFDVSSPTVVEMIRGRRAAERLSA